MLLASTRRAAAAAAAATAAARARTPPQLLAALAPAAPHRRLLPCRAAAMATDAAEQRRPIQAAMERKLTQELAPVRLSVVNESHKHAGHAGNPGGGPDAETHFKVEVVSASFEGKRLVQRHQLVYRLLDDELKGGVHALSMDTKTPSEAGLE